jgi:NAD(P)-dependent dehydrogenase (short-subunit alcohol dehydrogenase family)
LEQPSSLKTNSSTLAGSTVLITGATRGIGYATAEALARMDAAVIVHGRDRERVQSACRALKQSAPGATIHGTIADLGSMTQVRRLAQEIDDKHDRLDLLINNAGLVTRKRQETVDGLERQLAVNHLAPFLLTNLLLGKLKSSAPARIINVASNAHHRAALDRNDLNWERRPYSGIRAYGATKLANILFTRELSRRLEGTSVTANCLHPGVVATNIFTGMGIFGTLFGMVMKPFLLASDQGAATSVYLASSEEVCTVSGQYFKETKPIAPAPEASDDTAAKALWQLSEELTGLA